MPNGLTPKEYKTMRVNRTRRPSGGFSLIELLVVLAILGLLAGLVGPQVMKFLGGSKTKTAKLQIEDLSAAMDLFRLEVGRYPTSGEGLEALVQEPSGVSNWNGPYLRKRKIPQDPWGFDYHYAAPGENGPFDLFSLGADNAEGGEGENQDIVSWE
jgi:general secretion pathway protein G